MALGRDEKKYSSCNFVGHEGDCPLSCSRCSISYKMEADRALAHSQLLESERLYKKSVFLDPTYADGWYGLGSIYSSNSQYHLALEAYDKALEIDPVYGDAMLARAVAFQRIGDLETALALINELLSTYSDQQSIQLREGLQKELGTAGTGLYTCHKAKDLITSEAYNLLEGRNYLDADGVVRTDSEIDQTKYFAASVVSEVLGNDDKTITQDSVDAIITACFYGAIFIAGSYYINNGVNLSLTTYGFLKDSAKQDDIQRSAISLMDHAVSDNESVVLERLISNFSRYCLSVFPNIRPQTDLRSSLLDAAETAHVMGLVYARGHKEVFAKKKMSAATVTSSTAKPTQKTPPEFLKECILKYHIEAKKLGVADRGYIHVPELVPVGYETVLGFLKDPIFESMFSDPESHYYFIFSISIEAGMVFAKKWHDNRNALNDYIKYIQKVGPADDANELMRKLFSPSIYKNQGNPFFQVLFAKWLELHEPYWSLKDPREYTLNAMVAGYLLGVSMVLNALGVNGG